MITIIAAQFSFKTCASHIFFPAAIRATANKNAFKLLKYFVHNVSMGGKKIASFPCRHGKP